MMLAPAPTPRRRIGLTPMIDVVFLILVFFLIAARFGTETVINLEIAAPSGQVQTVAERPDLLEILPEGLRLNGVERPLGAIRERLAGGETPLVMRPMEGTSLQRVIDVLEGLPEATGRPVVFAE